jgi:nucleoprotein TPR
LKECEKNLDETRAQNSLLHGQLEKIGDQIENIQGGKAVEEGEAVDGSSSELGDMQKTMTELREVVKFVRSEKEMIQAQLDTARRSADRERATAAIAKLSLDEVRAELRTVQENSDSNGAADISVLKAKLKSAEEQCRLLGESNSHLREEMKTLETKLSSMKEELENSQKAAQPTEKRQQELEGEKAGLLAEKESLIREINDWKGRVQSLVTKFNQVSFILEALS